MAEPYDYRLEPIENREGNVVDYARMRRNRGEGWENAVFRGSGLSGEEPGVVRRSERGAAGRGASRNPAMARQIRQFRAVNRNLRRR